MIRILCLGDVVGPAAVETLHRRLWDIRKEKGVSFVVANGENASAGNGIDCLSAQTLLNSGVDVLTSGNHIWRKREIYEFMDDQDTLIRPCNYKSTNPGKGYTIRETEDGYRVLVMNVMGTVYMDSLDSPFSSVERILSHAEGKYDLSVLDVHAEATSEKLALAHYFDGRISVIFGTHTHVTTADEQILPRGTGYITDLGMCGPIHSVLGVRPDLIIDMMTAHMPVRFALSENKIELNGALFDLDPSSGHVVSAERIRF